MMTSQKRNTFSLMRSWYPWLIVGCGMLFYCYNYFLRVSAGVMQDQLSSAFHMNAMAFGTLAGIYYWSYTPLQLPAGMIYDRFGARFVLSAAVLSAVAGLWVFISTDHYYTAAIGRLMIGAGCAFSYIGTLKLASLWLPSNRFAFVAGLATAAGMTSGALGQRYLTAISQHTSYQETLYSVLLIGVALCALIITIVRSRPTELPCTEMCTSASSTGLLGDLKQVMMSKQMWLIGIIGCLVYLPSSVFLDTWGVPYLKSVYGLTQSTAVHTIGYTFYGWIVASPLLGGLSDKFRVRKVPLATCGLIAALLLCFLFYGPDLSLTHLKMIFFTIGFCCGSHSICFALGKENHPVHLSGTAVATTNMFIMAGGMIFQPLAGTLLDLHASGFLNAGGLRVYTPEDYHFALSIIPLGVVFGIFLCTFLKETHGEYRPVDGIEDGLQPALELNEEPELEPAQ